LRGAADRCSGPAPSPSAIKEEISEDDRTVVARLVRAALYPASHPYHHSIATAEIPAAGSLSRFFQEHVQPDQVVAIAVGDVARESFVDSMNLAFGSWQGRALARRPLPEPIDAPLGASPVTVIDRPRLATSSIVVAARGVPWSSADYYPLYVVRELLGRSIVGRLNQNLRETKAYSYWSGAEFGPYRGTASFEITGLATPENTADAMRQMRTEIERLCNEPLAVEELERVKTAVIRRIPTMFANLGAMLESLQALAAYDRPADDYSNLASALERVSAADVGRVARAYLAPNHLRWFVVADASIALKPIQTLFPGVQSLAIELARPKVRAP